MEEKNDKIFHLNCGRGSGKQTKMLEAAIKFAESNKGCGAFALITVDEIKRLQQQIIDLQNLFAELEIENKQLRELKDSYKEISKERRSIIQVYKDKCNNYEQMIAEAAFDFANYVGILNPKYNSTVDENITFYKNHYKARANKKIIANQNNKNIFENLLKVRHEAIENNAKIFAFILHPADFHQLMKKECIPVFYNPKGDLKFMDIKVFIHNAMRKNEIKITYSQIELDKIISDLNSEGRGN